MKIGCVKCKDVEKIWLIVKFCIGGRKKLAKNTGGRKKLAKNTKFSCVYILGTLFYPT